MLSSAPDACTGLRTFLLGTVVLACDGAVVSVAPVRGSWPQQWLCSGEFLAALLNWLTFSQAGSELERTVVLRWGGSPTAFHIGQDVKFAGAADCLAVQASQQTIRAVSWAILIDWFPAVAEAYLASSGHAATSSEHDSSRPQGLFHDGN